MTQAFEQRVRDGVQRVADQIGAVVDRRPFARPCGSRVAFSSSTASLMPVSTSRGILAAAHQDDAFDAAGLLVDAEDAGLRRGADLHAADVAHEDGHAFGFADHDVLDVLHGLRSGRRRGSPSPAACCRAARRRHSGCSPRRPARSARSTGCTSPAPCGSISIWYCLIRPPNGSDVGDAGHLQEARLDHPVLQLRAARIESSPAPSSVYRYSSPIGVDSGPSVGVTPSGSSRIAQLLEHHLAREVVVGPVGERQFDDRQSEDRPRPPGDDVRHAVQRALDRDGDLLLHFLRGAAGIQRDHDDLRVGDIGIGFDLQLLERPDAEPDQA